MPTPCTAIDFEDALALGGGLLLEGREARTVWAAMPEAERREASLRLPEFIRRYCKAGRRLLPSFAFYLKDRLWVSPAAAPDQASTTPAQGDRAAATACDRPSTGETPGCPPHASAGPR